MSQIDSSLSDQAAAEIASESYKRNKKNIKIPGDEKNVYNVVETIEDKDTGLHGYVLENEDSGDIAISFEGTQIGEGWDQGVNDIVEDASGFFLGSSDYTEKEQVSQTYKGTRVEDHLIEFGHAKVEDGQFIQLNKNQFTEADKVVKKQIEEHGAENITFVGHSLGGSLSKYFAIKYDSHAVTFAAPDIYNLLTDEEKKEVDNGDFDSNIISYSYSDDPISSYAHHKYSMFQ